jgi:acetyl-CoA carboxylase biotin carboxyl carrier protein
MAMKKTEQAAKANPDKRHAASASRAANEGEQMGLEEIKELIELVAEKQFSEFELERGDFRLRLQRGIVTSSVMEPVLSAAPQVIAAPAAAPESRPVEAAPAPASAAAAAAPAEEPLHLVTSPIVGTFFRAPSPTAEPFVKLGDAVEAGATLCIIEAMKLMNEIPSDVSGTIAKILVENGQPVEYGQPLFGLKV